MVKYCQSQESAQEVAIVTLKNWEDVTLKEKKQENIPPAHIQLGLMRQSKQLGSTGSKQAGEPRRGMMGWTLPRNAETSWRQWR